MRPVLHRAVSADLVPEWFEDRFAANGWTGTWRNGVFDWHHYHRTTHEVLGCYAGWADIQLGGERGETHRIEAGDVVVIPAGLAHKRREGSDDFRVVGAYPGGGSPDMNRGEGEPCPISKWARDPVTGAET
ncbi:cupin [Paracoccus salsus]|uniref:cupin n=1 Tax=Paracoccus salsus TaxID=2911061 RepID=UPI001F2557F2|nr:cupin [Paracoccus salsus]MCF3972172.1 cupin [Paracoccus salsus]